MMSRRGLILFKKRIDKMRNPRNNRVFDRLILESVDWGEHGGH